jgi:hypothetical protein
VANNPAAFLERLTAAEGPYNEAKVGTLGALDAVYLDIRPEVARMGQTIRVYYPDLGPFIDQAANDWNPDDINPGFVDVPFGQRPGKAILVRDFEQFQTSTDIIQQYLDPIYKRAMEYANGAIFGLLTPTNFPTTPVVGPVGIYPSYTPITTLPATVDIGSAQLAWSLLVSNKIPLTPENASILYHPQVHANTLTDPQWSQESLVSAMIALDVRRDAAEGGVGNQAFKFIRRFDQQAPTATSTARTGTVTVANGATTIVGSSTKFLTELSPTRASPSVTSNTTWVQFVGDSPLLSYPVTNVTSDTAATLGMAYQGSQTSGVTYTRTTYTGIAMHKFAIALAVRPLELVNTGGVSSTILTLRGLPIRVMLSFPHIKSGWLLTADYGMVAKVLRPDFGVLLNS